MDGQILSVMLRIKQELSDRQDQTRGGASSKIRSKLTKIQQNEL